MNKGKPSGFEADTKKDAGAKSTSYERYGTTGAGPDWTERRQARRQTMVHPAGQSPPGHWAGGPEHHGGDADEDRNP